MPQPRPPPRAEAAAPLYASPRRSPAPAARPRAAAPLSPPSAATPPASPPHTPPSTSAPQAPCASAPPFTVAPSITPGRSPTAAGFPAAAAQCRRRRLRRHQCHHSCFAAVAANATATAGPCVSATNPPRRAQPPLGPLQAACRRSGPHAPPPPWLGQWRKRLRGKKIEQMEKELLAGWDIPPSFALSYRCNGQAGRGGT